MRQLVMFLPLLLMAAQVDWQKDFASALQKAKKEHKVLMVFYESHGCSWCKKMLATTLRDAKVVKRLRNVVAVRVYKEDSNFPKSIHSPYTPTTFFLTPKLSNIIRPVLGYQNVEYFLSYLDDVERRKVRYMKGEQD